MVAHTAQMPPEFLNFVVALGSNVQKKDLREVEKKPPEFEWETGGTGFFFGYLAKDDPDVEKRQYEPYLVTAKHVVQGHETLRASDNRGELSVRVNPQKSSSPSETFPLSHLALSAGSTWFFHPNPDIDLAIFPINLRKLREQGLQSYFFGNDVSVANTDKLKGLEVAAGDRVFILGFPMNLAGVQRNYVIVRQGVIARISEMLDRASHTFLVDAFVFPGNSGGPVVLKPEIGSIPGTKSQDTAYLIGIVLSYIPFIDIAISPQTQKARIAFEENSGLAEILPTDYIEETIKAWHTKNASANPPKPQ
jgi:hypothetical protein